MQPKEKYILREKEAYVPKGEYMSKGGINNTPPLPYLGSGDIPPMALRGSAWQATPIAVDSAIASCQGSLLVFLLQEKEHTTHPIIWTGKNKDNTSVCHLQGPCPAGGLVLILHVA